MLQGQFIGSDFSSFIPGFIPTLSGLGKNLAFDELGKATHSFFSQRDDATKDFTKYLHTRNLYNLFEHPFGFTQYIGSVLRKTPAILDNSASASAASAVGTSAAGTSAGVAEE